MRTASRVRGMAMPFDIDAHQYQVPLTAPTKLSATLAAKIRSPATVRSFTG
jgi:hypothetical protein